MKKISIFFLTAILICSLIGCGEDEEEAKEPTKGTAVAVTVEQIVGTYDLVSFYDKDEDELLVIGTKEAGDLKHTRVINADKSYSLTETESGKTYTESGTFSLSGDTITFEATKSSNPKSVNMKNSYTVKIERDKLALTLKDSTDPLFKEDIGDVLNYKKK